MDKRNILLATATAALAICAVVIATMEPPKAEAPEDTRPPVQITDSAGQETDAQDKPTASDLWSDDGTLHQIKPLDVDLDAGTQWAIYRNCGYDPGLFSLVIAIAEHESELGPDLRGDNGQSIGIMQINERWHTGRMEALGVTDLTDPVQCAAVGLDYLQELARTTGNSLEDDALYMAYNMGPTGARRALEAGRTSTDYSKAVLAVYREYMNEMEWAG